MSTLHKNLSEFDETGLPSAAGMKFGIVVSGWNASVTEKLYDAAERMLFKLHCKPENIHRITVPGSFEIPQAAKWIAETIKPDAVICLGCVIQGETKHFDFICNAVSEGIMQLNLHFPLPFVFGVLTTLNMEQAVDRAGGKHGNKGIEAAITAVKMVQLKRDLR